MRRAALVTAVVVMLAGCSPKNVVIPSDPTKWDQLGKTTRELSDGDRSLLAGYLMRKTVGSALTGGSAALAPGTTVGEAIDDQRKFMQAQKQAEAAAAALQVRIAAKQAAATAEIRKTVTFAVLSAKVLPEDMMAGRIAPFLDFQYAVHNGGAKVIVGLRGKLILTDMFGTNQCAEDVDIQKPIAPGADLTGLFETAAVSDEEKAIAQGDMSRVKEVFEPTIVVFEDGSRIGDATPQQ